MKNEKIEFFQVFEPLFFGVKIGYCIFELANILSTSLIFLFSIQSSIIFLFGMNGDKSSNPNDLMAMSII